MLVFVIYSFIFERVICNPFTFKYCKWKSKI